MSLDAHARPPEPMRVLFKRWQKAGLEDINTSQEILDISSHEQYASVFDEIAGSSELEFAETCDMFLKDRIDYDAQREYDKPVMRELRSLPGLFVYPRLLPQTVQIALLDKLLHRDLSVPAHKSNLHLHYSIPYPGEDDEKTAGRANQSFFNTDQGKQLHPKDATVHKPLTVKQMLNRKLRWVTLGGQYDWTSKVYPSEDPPEFPEDIARLLKGLFPNVDAQAAIVNFYTPGDTLSVHRDVSEDCDRGLISVSIGCDGLFIIGNNDGSCSATIRLRSGDVVLMSGESRYAWHAVPKILPGTCPSWLQDWPASDRDEAFDNWRGWISNKRINLNVRQMRV